MGDVAILISPMVDVAILISPHQGDLEKAHTRSTLFRHDNVTWECASSKRGNDALIPYPKTPGAERLHHPGLLGVPVVGRDQYGYITRTIEPCGTRNQMG